MRIPGPAAGTSQHPLPKSPKSGLVAALLCAAGMWFYVNHVLVPYQVADAQAHERPRGNLSDLYPRWLGTRELLLHHRNPYSREITREIQRGYYGRELEPDRPGDPKDQQGFAYPVYVAFLLGPTVFFPFARVGLAFECLLVLLTAASVPLWLRVVGWRTQPSVLLTVLVLTVGSLPAVQGVKLQQLSLLVAAIIAGACALLARGQLFASGASLAVATIKPQLVLPLVLCLLMWTACDWRRRQPLFWGFAMVMAMLLGGAHILLPGWVGDFRTAVRDYRRYTGGMSLLDTLLSPNVGRVVTVGLLLTLVSVGWRLRRAEPQSREFAPMLAIILASTVIAIPMFTLYNLVFLLPAILIVVREWQGWWDRSAVSKFTRLLTVVSVGWPWLASIGLSIASLVLLPKTVQRGWAVPLYTIVMIPLVVWIQLASLMVEAQRSSALAFSSPPIIPPSTP